MEFKLEDIDAKNDESLETLARAITKSQGQFSLILSRCNYSNLRHRLMQKLADNSEVHFRELVLNSSIENLYDAIKKEFLLELPSALIISGLKEVRNLEEVLTITNQAREKFRDHFQFPLVLWVSEQVLQKMIYVARDFYTWASTPIEFELETRELIDLIEKTTDNVFKILLKAGASRFIENATLGLENNSSQWLELNSAYTELNNREVKLSTELEASLEFVLGRAKQGSSSDSHQAKTHYERSLALWQQLEIEGSYSTEKLIERRGCVLFYLGLWWSTYAERNRSDFEIAIGQAQRYFQECINIFEKIEKNNRPDLMALFINALAFSLHKLNKWDELEVVAKKALSLHQKRSDQFRMARAYGFLAEVALAKSRWTEAKELAEKAISTFEDGFRRATSNATSNKIKADLDWERCYHQGWYLFVLARAQAKLGHVKTAIDTLKNATKESKPEYDPRLYISLLEELHKLYFQQKKYLKAFESKLEQHSIEQQYGFRAFIGAGRLEPQRQTINPELPHIEKQEQVAKEISQSGRQEDIDNLVRRIGRNDCKLIVIYGQSGVGKSSLLQAGLMPTLKQNTIGVRTVVPVLLQSYSGYIGKLGKSLTKALIKVQHTGFTNKNLTSKDTTLDQLRENYQKNLLTVLILDEFESFFFSSPESEKKEFFLFLKECLDIPYTKIIISLREDYIHLLLQWNRLTNLDVINNNILDKNILYYLGNYSKENTKSLITSLIKSRQFSPELELIDQLVEDLAEESGEIRPIELQLIGYQLETEKITTLKKYQGYAEGKNSKRIIIGHFLEEVIKNCGSENEEIARFILYLLTDENYTLPTKTFTELESYIEIKRNQLKLVLAILTKSWLVLEEPSFSSKNYRLAHDYLAPFIRQDKKFSLIRLKEELKHTKEELRQALFKEQQAKKQLEIAEIETLSLLAKNQLLSGDQLGAAVAGVKACKHWLEMDKNADIDPSNFGKLRQAIYGVKELNRFEGHDAGVWDVSFSPDGKILASASYDETIKLWRLDGSKIRTLRGHTDWVECVAFSPDGQLIASASEDKTVKLWKLDGSEITLERTLEAHSASVKSICFSPDGQLLASASDDKTIKLWKLDGTEITLERTLEGHQDLVLSVDFRPDGQLIASASEDKTVKLWKLDGSKTLNFQKHNASVRSVRFSPDGQLLASVSINRMIKIWRVDGTEVQTIKGHTAGVTGISFHPSQPILASASTDQTVRLWQIGGAAWKILNGCDGHRDRVYSVNFSPNGKMLASSSADKTVKLWQVNEHKVQTFEEHTDFVRGLHFSPNGKMLASSGADKAVIIRQLDSKKSTILPGHEAKVWSVDFSPDSKILASGSDDKTVRLWQLNENEIEKPNVIKHERRVRSVRFSPNGKILASGTDDGIIHLWGLNGQPIYSFEANKSKSIITSLSFHKDGNKLASVGAEKIIKLWQIRQINGVEKENCNVTPIQTFAGHSAGVWSVSFSPDGEMLASAGSDGTVRLWRLDGTEIQIFQAHDAAVLNVSFSPDGKLLASSSADRSIKLWRLDNLQPQAADLEGLLKYGCDWTRDYLRTNLNVSESDRLLCEGKD